MSYSLEERLQMMIRVGRRFNIIAIPSLIILIGTGIYNSYSFFNNFELLFSTSYGNLLTIKIILVMALIITYIIHVRIIRKEGVAQDSSGFEARDVHPTHYGQICLLGEIIVI